MKKERKKEMRKKNTKLSCIRKSSRLSCDDSWTMLKCMHNTNNNNQQTKAKWKPKYTQFEVSFEMSSFEWIDGFAYLDMFTFAEKKKNNNLLWSHRYLQNYANCMPTDHIHHAFELFLALCFFRFGWDSDNGRVVCARAGPRYGLRDRFSVCCEELLVDRNSFFFLNNRLNFTEKSSHAVQ